jgi:hypothetical protein
MGTPLSPNDSSMYPPIEVQVRRVKRRSASPPPPDSPYSSIRRAAIIFVGVSLSSMAVSWRHMVTSHTIQRHQESRIENRHPLSAATVERRRQLRVSSVTTVPKLHYLSFGSSNTWGIGLSNTNWSRAPKSYSTLEAAYAEIVTIHSTSYPSLLDSEGLTVALPSSRWYVDFAAACTQSLVEGIPSQTDTFHKWTPDVITVEYSAEMTQSHVVLLQRLRRRYPLSILVLVQLFQPATQLYLVPQTGRGSSKLPQSLQAWMVNQTLSTDTSATSDTSQLDDTTIRNLARSILLAAADGSHQWTVETSAQPLVKQLVDDDPLMLHYNGLSTLHTQTQDELVAYLTLFTNDVTDLNTFGHARVARDVQSLVEQSSALWSIRHGKLSAPLGDWGSGDECHIWYATGNYKLESSGRRVNLPTLPGSSEQGPFLTVSSPQHKHALEFVPRSNPPPPPPPLSSDPTQSDQEQVHETNVFTVHNPFATDRLLSLTYLTDADGMTYPRTRVVLNGVPTLVVHPIHTLQDVPTETRSDNGHYDHHVSRTTGVGYIPPGTSTVRLDPLQATHLPFRLLGASLLAEEVQDLTSIEFSLETE